jgi:hypothetical protein
VPHHVPEELISRIDSAHLLPSLCRCFVRRA